MDNTVHHTVSDLFSTQTLLFVADHDEDFVDSSPTMNAEGMQICSIGPQYFPQSPSLVSWWFLTTLAQHVASR